MPVSEISNIRGFPKKGEQTTQNDDLNAGAGVAEELQARGEAPQTHPGGRTTSAAASPARGGGRRRIAVSLIGVVILLGGAWFGYGYLTQGRFIVSTDDAYVRGDIAAISAKVSGYVASVDVAANQKVRAGDPLVTLDAGDYTIARDQAQALIDTENLTLKRIDAQIDGARAAITQAEAQKSAAEATQRNADLAQRRAQSLSVGGSGTQATLDAANAALEQANANVKAAGAAIASANANVAVLQGQRAEAAGTLKMQGFALDKANRDLSFTVLRAPYDGIVGNLSVQKGDLVSPGVRLAAIVPSGQLYVEANFKETQIGRLVPGEKVLIHIDAEGGDTIVGIVESVAPASGSVFSLLPAENATGNFTKVVQRVPVRIALPREALDAGRLRAGLSVVVDADTRTIPQGSQSSAGK